MDGSLLRAGRISAGNNYKRRRENPAYFRRFHYRQSFQRQSDDEYAQKYPEYCFNEHKGYGTKNILKR